MTCCGWRVLMVQARNVLIDSTFQAKVSDFGFARATNENDAYEQNLEGQIPV
jgi:hypothetical protein